MNYKQLGWEEYQPYESTSEEIWLEHDDYDHYVGLVNHAIGVYTLRDGIELGHIDIISDGEESYVDRTSVEAKQLLAVTKALSDEELGADLKESFINHYQDLCILAEKSNNLQTTESDSKDEELGFEERPALHLASDKELLTLIRQIKQAQRFGDKEEVSKRASEFIEILKQRMNGEPKPTGVRELKYKLYKEIGLEFEPEDDEDREWLAQNQISESVYGSIDITTRPKLTQSDKAYQSILNNLHQAEVELNKAHHMSSKELLAKTLELMK
ncbi:TPA: hypothetical protein I7217_16905 [Vibrio vulnificus]|nr:hypothetical protein [Vibrio vulnificus]